MTNLGRGVSIDDDGRITGIRRALKALLQEKTAELAELAKVITILELQIREMPDEFDLTDLPGLPVERHQTWEQ